jgi:hypothetical protein
MLERPGYRLRCNRRKLPGLTKNYPTSANADRSGPTETSAIGTPTNDAKAST